jgi:PAS domain S-box-containing protein
MPADALRDLIERSGMDAEEVYRRLVRRSGVPMGLSDAQTGRFVLANHAFAEWLGYTDEEILRKSWSDFSHPDDIQATRQLTGQVLRGEIDGYRLTKRYRHRNGHWLWGDLSVSTLRATTGEVIAFIGQIVDVTAGVLAQEALQASEARFRRLAENSTDIVWEAGPQRVVTYVSPSITPTLGWARGDVLGRPLSGLVHPDDLPLLPIETLLQSGSVSSRARVQHKDGHYVWCEVHSVLTTAEGQTNGFIGTMRDISSQVDAQERIAASERRYRLVAENASDVVFEGDRDAVIRWASPSVKDELGYLPDEVVGRKVVELLHPADAPDMLRASHEVNEGQRAGYRARVRRKDGSYRWMEVNAKPLFDEQGNVIARVGSMRDVDQQMRTQQALARAKDEALAASLAKTAFLSRMSHELRTPLNAVLGFAQLLAMDPLTADQREALSQISIGGHLLLDLISELLDISRIEAGQLSLSLEAVAVADAIAETIDLVSPMAAGAGIELATSDSPCDCFVMADRQRLIQILLNLATNAVKYHRPHGIVRIDCQHAHDGQIRVDVADNGPGIADADLARLFQPFERLTTRADVEGTGIGLALSRGLTQAMAGSLVATSELGKGSVFTVTLPASETACEIPIGPTPVVVATGSPRRVLYIEDNPANALLVRQLCSLRENTLLQVCPTGLEGLQAARLSPPDLLLLDLHLPDVTGAEVLTRLRQDELTCDVPIVVLSADATPAARTLASELGADGFLSKPIDINDVLNWIESPRRPTGRA